MTPPEKKTPLRAWHYINNYSGLDHGVGHPLTFWFTPWLEAVD
jgi:hypothetical protein